MPIPTIEDVETPITWQHVPREGRKDMHDPILLASLTEAPVDTAERQGATVEAKWPGAPMLVLGAMRRCATAPEVIPHDTIPILDRITDLLVGIR